MSMLAASSLVARWRCSDVRTDGALVGVGGFAFDNVVTAVVNWEMAVVNVCIEECISCCIVARRSLRRSSLCWSWRCSCSC